MNFITWRVLWKRIKAIRFFLMDKAVPLRKKLLVIGGIVYLCSPLDLVPEPVLLVGLVDDIVLWLFLLHYLAEELDRYWMGEKEIDLRKNYKGKHIIDDVEFHVEDRDAEKGRETGGVNFNSGDDAVSENVNGKEHGDVQKEQDNGKEF